LGMDSLEDDEEKLKALVQRKDQAGTSMDGQ
jgi:hypothetical protein